MSLLEQPLPSTVAENMRNCNRIIVKNVPTGITKNEVFSFLNVYGPVKSLNLVHLLNSSRIEVTFECSSVAWKAYEGLQNFVYKGFLLQVEFSGSSVMKPNHVPNRSGAIAQQFNNNPLRLLVPTSYVGTIIGKKGQTIKSITTNCKARIDVHGRENSAGIEKMISIYGQVENRSQACREILKVLRQENLPSDREEITLRMLANDQHCGRLIGKDGKNIKKIKEDTGTKIIISNSQDSLAVYPDRTISIVGTIDNVVTAESLLSSKLDSCIETDASKVITSRYLSSLQVSGRQGFTNYLGTNLSRDVCQVCIPNSAVGSIIGTGGASIQKMMKDSGADIFVEPRSTNVEFNPSTERIVTIRGSLTDCWKGCYLIFEKMKSEGFSGGGETHLRTILKVPAAYIGRLIGKSGKNVKEIQRWSRAIIRMPVDDPKPARRVLLNEDGTNISQENPQQVSVGISGDYQAVKDAHLRIRDLVQLYAHQSSAVH